jgi:predicted nucleic acid-binding protein
MTARPLNRIRPSGPASREGAARGLLLLIFLADLAAVVLHLWGRVQIDFAVRRNEKRMETVRRLQDEVEALGLDIDRLQSYAQVASAARGQGLVFVPADRLQDLVVDLEGVRIGPPAPKLAVAALAAPGAARGRTREASGAR